MGLWIPSLQSGPGGAGAYLRRTRDTGGSSLSPDQVTTATLKYWLKADAGTFQSSGGSAATADGDPVGEWQDQSGNAFHVTETTNKPTLRLAIQNGRSVIRFDGSNDKLIRAAGSPTVTNPLTVLLAASDQQANVRTFFSSRSSATPAYSGSTSGSANMTAGTTLTITGIVPGVTFALITLVFNGVSSKARKNNGSYTTGNAGGNSLSGLSLGALIGSAAFQQMDLGEFVIFEGAVSDAELDGLNVYLNGRWAAF